MRRSHATTHRQSHRGAKRATRTTNDQQDQRHPNQLDHPSLPTQGTPITRQIYRRPHVAPFHQPRITQHDTAHHSLAHYRSYLSLWQHKNLLQHQPRHGRVHDTTQYMTIRHRATKHFNTRYDTTRYYTTRHETTRHRTAPHHITPTTPHHPITPHTTPPHPTTPHHTMRQEPFDPR